MPADCRSWLRIVNDLAGSLWRTRAEVVSKMKPSCDSHPCEGPGSSWSGVCPGAVARGFVRGIPVRSRIQWIAQAWCLWLGALLGVVPGLAGAESADVASERCESAAARAAQRHGVPLSVMLAIAHVETGRADRSGQVRPWPWAINLAGQGAWPRSKAEALSIARAAVSQGKRNVDLGCFQINLHWHGAEFSSLEHMLDPDQNADYAARFLTELHARHGSWVLAAGAYHSATPHLAAAYRGRFERAFTAVTQNAPPLATAARTRRRMPVTERRPLFDAPLPTPATGSVLTQLATLERGAALPAPAGAIALEAWP